MLAHQVAYWFLLRGAARRWYGGPVLFRGIFGAVRARSQTELSATTGRDKLRRTNYGRSSRAAPTIPGMVSIRG